MLLSVGINRSVTSVFQLKQGMNFVMCLVDALCQKSHRECGRIPG